MSNLTTNQVLRIIAQRKVKAHEEYRQGVLLREEFIAIKAELIAIEETLIANAEKAA